MSGANAPPSLTVSANGQGVVTDALLNTYVQGGALVANLYSFTGLSGMTAYLIGLNAPGDGGGGAFYWNSTSTATDDGGVTTVAPYGTLTGRWIRIQGANIQENTTGSSPIVSNVQTTILSATLSPGIWLVTGVVQFIAASGTTISQLSVGISETPASFVGNATAQLFELAFQTSSMNQISSGVAILTIDSPTQVYLVAVATFAVSTMQFTASMVAKQL